MSKFSKKQWGTWWIITIGRNRDSRQQTAGEPTTLPKPPILTRQSKALLLPLKSDNQSGGSRLLNLFRFDLTISAAVM